MTRYRVTHPLHLFPEEVQAETEVEAVAAYLIDHELPFEEAVNLCVWEIRSEGT